MVRIKDMWITAYLKTYKTFQKLNDGIKKLSLSQFICKDAKFYNDFTYILFFSFIVFTSEILNFVEYDTCIMYVLIFYYLLTKLGKHTTLGKWKAQDFALLAMFFNIVLTKINLSVCVLSCSKGWGYIYNVQMSKNTVFIPYKVFEVHKVKVKPLFLVCALCLYFFHNL